MDHRYGMGLATANAEVTFLVDVTKDLTEPLKRREILFQITVKGDEICVLGESMTVLRSTAVRVCSTASHTAMKCGLKVSPAIILEACPRGLASFNNVRPPKSSVTFQKNDTN